MGSNIGALVKTFIQECANIVRRLYIEAPILFSLAEYAYDMGMSRGLDWSW